MGRSGKSVAIAGAGIGGLAAGLAFLQRGWSVRIFEQSDEIRILGAGIYMWENGLRVLEALGVYDRVVADAVPVRLRERRDERGNLLGVETTTSSGRLFVPLRRSLLGALRDAVLDHGGEFVFGRSVAGATPDGLLRFTDGGSVAADLVIGADGINSRVRDSLGLLRWRRPANQHGYRIMIGREAGEADDPARSLVSEHWSGGRRLLYAPSTRDQVYVQLTTLRGDPAAGAAYDPETWLSTFPHLRWIIDRIPVDGKNDWFESVRLKRWFSGRVAIVGDAASAQPPFLGQGGGIAMMAALSLADAVSGEADLPAGLALWEARERRFVEWVQSVSGWYGDLARLPPVLRRGAVRVIGGTPWIRRRTIRCAAVRRPYGTAAPAFA